MKCINSLSGLLIAITLLLSQGCSTTWYEHRQNWNAGWRNGIVVPIDPALPYATNCMPGMAEAPTVHFVAIEYLQAKRRHRTMLAVTNDQMLKQGERVRFNRTSCTVIPINDGI